jgi:hypothetical protein
VGTGEGTGDEVVRAGEAVDEATEEDEGTGALGSAPAAPAPLTGSPDEHAASARGTAIAHAMTARAR